MKKVFVSVIGAITLIFGVSAPAMAATSTGFDQSTGPDWLASIRAGDQSFCSGELVSANYVLTAAHCLSSIENYSSMGITVKLGPNAELTTREVDYIYIPHTNTSLGISQEGTDIMLLHLTSPVEDIEPATVGSVSSAITESGSRYSYSVTNYGWSPKTNVNIVPGTITQRTYWTFGTYPQQIGYIIDSSTSARYAKGDSGGPVVDSNGRLIGTLSGIEANSTNNSSSRGTFVPTLPYATWINTVLNGSGVVSPDYVLVNSGDSYNGSYTSIKVLTNGTASGSSALAASSSAFALSS
ncbi:MAG: S1 family peptidase [Corynebacterium sp.]|nr:S1 family peptidase [Corynebacterium sp.]